MMAFTPAAPPPSAEHLAQISEALCARAEARERAAKTAALRRGALWRQELMSLRNTAPQPRKAAPRATSAAAVLEARLARICPPVKVDNVVTPVESLTTDRIDAYNARMARYFTPVSDISKTPVSEPLESAAPAPSPKPKDATRGAPFRPLTIKEPVLGAAPTRKAITPMPVKPMLKGVKSAVDASASESVNATVKEELRTEQGKEDGVQRPSWLIDFIVSAVAKFAAVMKKKEPEEPKKETEAVAW